MGFISLWGVLREREVTSITDKFSCFMRVSLNKTKVYRSGFNVNLFLNDNSAQYEVKSVG